MVYTVRHPQRGLPVTLQLVAAEVKIPVRNSVQFAGHAFPSILMADALCLLCCRIFTSVAQHVNSGKGKTTQSPHRFSYSLSLGLKSRLFHHMARQTDLMLRAPFPDLV